MVLLSNIQCVILISGNTMIIIWMVDTITDDLGHMKLEAILGSFYVLYFIKSIILRNQTQMDVCSGVDRSSDILVSPAPQMKSNNNIKTFLS